MEISKEKIINLIDKFERLSKRTKKEYKEASTINVFVRPLFEALGWDFTDINQVEPDVRIIPGRTRADYIFKTKGIARFTLEVKPLSHPLTDEDRKQAISYAYNKGVSWAGLTNFEQLELFSVEWQTWDLNEARFLNLNYKDYLTNFTDLILLSPREVEGSALDKAAERYGKLPRRIPIEKRLYQQLREWREKLFNEIYQFHKGKAITLPRIDNLIQQLFNRLIFIRTAEDRNLEEKRLLAMLHRWKNKGGELIEPLRQIFHYFSNIYNSDLFPLMMDDWDQIWVSSHLLSKIIEGLYQVPGDFARYDFSVIDADILGAIYEQYLGYVAQIAKKEIEITEKKERRKQVGIYYTPKWVTDYIVKQTIGRFLRERGYDEVLNIKILDPACGSGSFLIRAYDELLNYHSKIEGKPVSELDWATRIKILTRNIFGVDLDRQAVEIAKLNLLLRALAKREILPSLEQNIKQGNSLLSGSEEELRQYFGDKWKEKFPFNWEEEFPEIIRQGGFDVIIGNPPYGRLKQVVKDHQEKEELSHYFSSTYQYQRGNLNFYKLFLERSYSLLKEGGYFSMIFPTAFLGEESSILLRRLFFENAKVLAILQIPERSKVFPEVTQDLTIFVYQKVKEKDYTFLVKTGLTPEEVKKLNEINWIEIKRSQIADFTQREYRIPSLSYPEQEWNILKKISQFPPFKGSKDIPPIGTIGVGQLDETFDKEFISYKPTGDILVKGIHLKRYFVDLSPEGKQPRWVRKAEFLQKKPHAKESIEQERIIGRNTLNRAIRPRLLFTSLPAGFVITNAIKYIILNPQSGLHKNYIIALLNSTLLNWRFELFSIQNNIRNYEIEALPIPRIDFSNPAEKNLHDNLVALVDKMLELNKKLAGMKDALFEERREVEREIKRTDERIDRLVYELYGLVEEEIKIVEASVKR